MGKKRGCWAASAQHPRFMPPRDDPKGLILWLDDMAFNGVFYRKNQVVKPMTYRILVVDDNEMNLTLISKILGLDGYQVILAGNGQEAIQSYMQQTPDLTVLDVMMPDMNGFDLCRKLREPPVNAVGPIVMLTALNSEIEKQHAMNAGANDIWSKPFDMELFRQRIRELLGSAVGSEKK